MVREQAKDLGLFNNTKRFVNISLNETEETEKEENCDSLCEKKLENFDEKLEEKIHENQAVKNEQISEEKYVISIPKNAVKQDLHDLKSHLQTLET